MYTLIKNGTIVNEGLSFVGNILLKDDRIIKITVAPISIDLKKTKIVDATGLYILPGVIDTHVHFREPGLTYKADIQSESRAAAYGGVTSYFDMPNCQPQTTTLEALTEKIKIAKKHSHVNFSFFFGATNDNVETFKRLDKTTVPGIKLFMGSSTGNMLVDNDETLTNIFSEAKANGFLIMAHCEDSKIINENLKKIQKEHGNDAPIELHAKIRSREACLASTKKAIKLSQKTGAHLHIAHISTEEEIETVTHCSELQKHLSTITLEACVPHIIFTDKDYETLKSCIKCNPAIKTESDRKAILKALRNNQIETIATDHAPHIWEEKQGGCLTATSGMPMLQFSLISIIEIIGIENTVKFMSHNPANLFKIKERGFLREGYKADITIVKHHTEPWTLDQKQIQSKCGWSPLVGRAFHWQVVHTFCNGNHILNNGVFNENFFGEQIILN